MLASASTTEKSPPSATRRNATPAERQPRGSAKVSATCWRNTSMLAVMWPRVSIRYVAVRLSGTRCMISRVGRDEAWPVR